MNKNLLPKVALRKESVDRNIRVNKTQNPPRSLSARRAWIEIRVSGWRLTACPMSLSARRAWIEIIIDEAGMVWDNRRSPQGERG